MLTHRAVLALAGPAMLANLSGPLIAVVDTAVVGQIPNPVHIGAVAIGSLIFSFVFWTFGFLRMGTTGLTAQAVGARDETEVAATLGRALLIAGSIGLAIVALQWPIRELAFALLGASAEVERLARGYFDIRIWAAPATACLLRARRLVDRHRAHRPRARDGARVERHERRARRRARVCCSAGECRVSPPAR